jgi:hypothetical protein
LDEARREVLPEQHGPGHEHVGGVVPVQQVFDPVREVEVARDDPDLELDPAPFLELARVALDARDIGVRVRAEEPDARHRSTSMKRGNERRPVRWENLLRFHREEV